MVIWVEEQEDLELLAWGLHLALSEERNHGGYVERIRVHHFEMTHVDIATYLALEYLVGMAMAL